MSNAKRRKSVTVGNHWEITLSSLRNKNTVSIFRSVMMHSKDNLKDAFKLFDTIVRPILCYGAEIWGYQYSGIIEKVHTDLCRLITG
jgi:hypothetical protein